MRYARHLITIVALLALTLLGLTLAPTLAHIADITDLQAGLIVGAAITWALFRIDAMVSPAEPASADQHD